VSFQTRWRHLDKVRPRIEDGVHRTHTLVMATEGQMKNQQMTLGGKIVRILVYRILDSASPATHRLSDLAFGRTYDLNDDMNEMMESATIENYVELHYRKYLKSMSIGPQWKKYTIPQEQTASGGGLTLNSQDISSSFWWLNGCHAVYVKGGTVEARCQDGRIRVRNRNVKWEWHDEIDANSYSEVWEKSLHNVVATAVEGTYDVVFDKSLDVEFKIRIHWTDDRE
ncbi:MAG: hypothetical protein JXL80_17485, partial [Planctomycetes bacterium]|nr:hypothetical protein [Planctomycetota bacterium]